jgi:origin recognition complex subunit 3
VQENISAFISSSQSSQGEPGSTIPAALIVAGPSIASHGPFFQRLGRKIKSDANCAYVVLTSGECPNLKSLLKQLIKKATSRIDDDNDDEDRPTASSRFGPRLLNYDLGHVQEWQKQNRASSIVIAIQDSEAFDTGLLNDFIDLLRLV